MFTGFGLGPKVILVKLSTRVFFRLAGALRSLVGGGVVNSNISVAFCDVRNVPGIRVSLVVLGSTIRSLVGGGVVNSNVPVAFCDARNVPGIRVSFVVLGSTISALKCSFSEIGFSSRWGMGGSRFMVVSSVKKFWDRASW